MVESLPETLEIIVGESILDQPLWMGAGHTN